MAEIRVLDKHTAELIAAGEVVERPASVAKELLENAIDAGATQITLSIVRGGIQQLQIADNGSGIEAEYIDKAFVRHATSKIASAEDLGHIHTLGFRGEALASIASVARVEVLTRTEADEYACCYRIEGGEPQGMEPGARPRGTTVTVNDLFYNTPARMKFLKKDVSEGTFVADIVLHEALSHPEIAFRFLRDGKQQFMTPGDGQLRSAAYAVLGREFARDLLPLDGDGGVYKVTGLVTPPRACRASRSAQHFYVNGRYVKSLLMQAAMEEAYRNAIITGKYPSGALFLDLPLSAVDVNVHPAKTEVKFSQEKPIFEVVYIACKNALAANDNMPHLEHKEKEAPAKPREDNLTHEQQRFAIPKSVDPKPFVTPSVKPTPIAPVKNDEEAPDLEDFLVSIPPKAERPRSASSYLSAPRILQEEPQEPVRTRMAQPVEPVTEPTPAVHTPTPEPEDEPMVVVPSVSAPEVKGKPQILQPLDTGVRVIGECFQTYIIAEDKDGLILIDKHAAHERILFNKLRAETDMPQQQLLTPVIVELTGEEAAAVQSQIEDIRQAGFAIDSFGENSFAVRSVPAYLDSGDVQSVISELAEKAMNSRTTVPDRLDDLIHTVACKAAIKAGKPTTMTELQDLCERVLSDDNVRSCPHGRPTTVRLTKYELDKMFKRVNQ